MDNIKNYEKLGAICGQIVYLYKNPVLFDSLSVKAVMGQINEIMEVLGDDWKVEDALLKNCLYALMGIISHKPSENGTIEDTFYHSANEKEFWDNIKVGKTYIGTISKIESYGLFVSLGDVRGLLHISEMSWGRVENPQKIFKAGAKVKVLVKEINGTNKYIFLYSS